MISKSFAKGLNFPALFGTSLGVLIPVLPAFAATPNFSHLKSIENSLVANSEPLPIAQVFDSNYTIDCPRAETVIAFTTDNYYVNICLDGNGDYFYYGVEIDDPDSVINIYDVTFTDSGSYQATTQNGYTYLIGLDSLEVYDPNWERIGYEPVRYYYDPNL